MGYDSHCFPSVSGHVVCYNCDNKSDDKKPVGHIDNGGGIRQNRFFQPPLTAPDEKDRQVIKVISISPDNQDTKWAVQKYSAIRSLPGEQKRRNKDKQNAGHSLAKTLT
jgi:hypothetical protein